MCLLLHCRVFPAVAGGDELRRAVQSTITPRRVNELKRLFHYSAEVAEMLDPFKAAYQNPMFVRMCEAQCKKMRSSESLSASTALVLSLDQIALGVS